MTDHKGLPVAGYLPQTDEKVALVNANKELEERVLRRIEWFENENKKAYIRYCEQLPEGVDVIKQVNDHKFVPPYDPRMLKLAFTGIQESMMWFNRAIFAPSRVSLPEDNNDASV